MKIIKYINWSLIQLITFIRLIMGILIFLNLFNKYHIYFFTIGVLSDGIDGFLARYLQVTSKFGEIFDALCDKSFIYLVLFSLYINNYKIILYSMLLKDILVLTGGIYSRYFFNEAIRTLNGRMSMLIISLYLFLKIYFNLNKKIYLYLEYGVIINIYMYICEYLIIFYNKYIKHIK